MFSHILYSMPESVTKDDVFKIASIARLKISDEEAEKYAKDLESILESFEVLNEANVDNLDPAFHPIEIANVTRKDVVKESVSRDEAFKNTKNEEDGYFKGPKVV